MSPFFFLAVLVLQMSGCNSSFTTTANTVSNLGDFSILSLSTANTQATLYWTVSAEATAYTVKYGTTSGVYTTVVTTQATSPLTITGLTNGTTYYFMVTATNTTGAKNAAAEASERVGYKVGVSWTANHERAVNKTGGGYKVYYSTTAAFATSGASYKDVPFVSGSTAPVSTSLVGLVAGRYYIKVVAYSALASTADPTGSTSSPSSEISLVVP